MLGRAVSFANREGDEFRGRIQRARGRPSLPRLPRAPFMSNARVALIRGINVGRAKRVAMADLRAGVEGLGYGNVRTVLNSGNVVFTVPKGKREEAAAGIAGVLEQLGVSARVTVLSAKEVAAAIAENPLGKLAHDPSRLLVMVPADAKARALLGPLSKEHWAPEAMAIGTRVAYLWCPDGIIDSRLAAAVGRQLGEAGTARNLATMLKLHALCSVR